VKPGERSRAIARINAAMAVPALTGLGAAVLVYGLLVGPPWDGWLTGLQFLCVVAFVLLQLSKLLVAGQPIEYLRTRWLDFSMLAVLASQVFVYLGLSETPEAAYLAARDIPDPTWALLVAVVQLYFLAIVAARSALANQLLLRLRLAPAQMAVVSFGLLVTAGTVALMLPGCHREAPLPVVDALFTATSAGCVTGLVVVDTARQFSKLGYGVLLVLIQVGGLGVLTLTTAFAVFAGRRYTGGQEQRLAAAIADGDVADVRSLLRRILGVTLAIEAAGAAALFWAWGPLFPDAVTRGGWAVFHAVSAFCNAGFSLFKGNASLTGLVGDLPTNLVIAALIVLGGLGFVLLIRLGARATRRDRSPLDWDQRAALAMTAFLVVAGMLLLRGLEGARSLAPLDGGTKWLASFFQSVTLRTAGFNSLDVAAFGLPAVVLSIVWMLIGGSPGGTAGGMKTTTAAALLPATLRGGGLGEAARRRAARVALAFLGTYALVALLLALAQGALDRRVAFEAASALGTVGLSMNLTPELTTAGKLVLVAAMFAGRVGPLVLASALLKWEQTNRGQLP
jgi:trk system potassium uptake protein TrkH